MTPVMCCGFECGAPVGNGSHMFDGGGTLTASISTTTLNNGLRAGRCNPTAQTCSFTTANHTSSTRHIGRVYLRFATLPSADAAVLSFGFNDTLAPNVRFKQSDSKLYAAVSTTFGATGVAVTTGVWYRVDYDFNVNGAGADFCDCQIDGVACGQATATGTSGSGTNDSFGFIASSTADMFLDDVVISSTAADYPIGAGKVLSFVPNVDGTHTATGTDIVKGTTGTPVGTAITNATTDAFNWVNARPIGGGASDNTRLINQQTVAATEYVEVGFEDAVEVLPPRAVEVLTADRQAATQAGLFQTKLNDNGTEDAIANRGSVAGVTSDRFVTKQYATMVGGGAWTLSRFNGLKARFGYSSDATPDQYWRGIMIEAEFPLSLPAGMYGEPDGPPGQRLMTQLLAQ